MTLFATNFISIKQDAPWLTGGAVHWQFPALNFGGTIKKKYLPYCNSCPFKTAHDAVRDLYFVPDATYPPATYIPDDYRITKQDVRRLTQAVWLLGYIYYGVEYKTGYNAPDGGNISQQQTFEILSCSGNQLTVKGINPKRVNIGGKYCHIPTGAMATFSNNSVLSVKSTPWVVKIESQDNDETDSITVLTLSDNVDNAITPIDLIDTTSTYYVTVRWYQNYPENWTRVETDNQIAWTQKTITIDATDLTGGLYIYNDRILYPGNHDTGGYPVFSAIVSDDTGAHSVQFSELDIQTVQTVAGWSTSFNFSSFVGFTGAVLMLTVPAGAGDTPLIWLDVICKNSRFDASGSYKHDVNNYCNYAFDEDGNLRAGMTQPLNDFRDDCYQPECPGYTATGGCNCDSPGWYERLIVNGDLRIRQAVAGYPAAVIERVSGGAPSLALMAGFYYNNVSRVYGVPWRELFNGAICGQRQTYADATGQHQRIRYGAFWARGEFDIVNFGNSGAGLFPAESALFGVNRYADGTTVSPTTDPDNVMTYYPARDMGGVHPYEYALEGSGLCKTQMTDGHIVPVIIPGYFRQEPTDEQALIIDAIRGAW